MSTSGSVRSSSARLSKRFRSAGSTRPGSSTKHVIRAVLANSGSTPATNSAGPVGAGGRVVASPTCKVIPERLSRRGSSGPPGDESVLLGAVKDVVEPGHEPVDAEGDLPQRRVGQLFRHAPQAAVEGQRRPVVLDV